MYTIYILFNINFPENLHRIGFKNNRDLFQITIHNSLNVICYNI